MQKYRFLTGSADKIASVVIAIMLGVEFTGASIHFVPEHKYKVPIAAIVTFFLTALAMIWHHSHLHAKVERYRILLSSLMVLLEEQLMRRTSWSAEIPKTILDSFVSALGHHRKAALNASILCCSLKRDSPFIMCVQDSGGYFHTAVRIDATDSVAAKAVKQSEAVPRSLVYVPTTKYTGAVLISTDKPNQKVYQRTDRIDSAYTFVDSSYDWNALHCLLCINIPLPASATFPDAAEYRAVLCLGGTRPDCLGTIEFAAARVAAALLSLVISQEGIKNLCPDLITS